MNKINYVLLAGLVVFSGLNARAETSEVLAVDNNENPVISSEHQSKREFIKSSNRKGFFKCLAPGCTKVFPMYTHLKRHEKKYHRDFTVEAKKTNWQCYAAKSPVSQFNLLEKFMGDVQNVSQNMSFELPSFEELPPYEKGVLDGASYQ